MESRVATVVIPVYKPVPDADERRSFVQCCRVLGRHKVVLVSSRELDCGIYLALFEQYKIDFEQVFFEARFFQSLEGYNELMLDPAFYHAFSSSEYILIYQLDAWVFRDELSDWCSRGYDYIGAPWFRKFWRFPPSKTLFGVGNGGFSLRRVRACLDVLECKGPFKTRSRDVFGKNHNWLIVHLKKLPFSRLRRLRFANTVDFFRSINRCSEDRFWGLDTQNANVPFRVAPLDEAMKFAFEVHPGLLFELNDKQLPFGCHAWMCYEPDFWAKWIFR